MTPLARSAFLLAGLAATTVHAADFDGSKRLICAPVTALECPANRACSKELPADLGLPAFLRIDFARKVIVGPKRTTPIAHMDSSDKQLLLQGFELGFAWSLALDKGDGLMSATLTDRNGAFVFSGPCTPD